MTIYLKDTPLFALVSVIRGIVVIVEESIEIRLDNGIIIKIPPSDIITITI